MKHASPPTTVGIISRKDVPSLHHINIKGKKHNLGVLKDLRKHDYLASFIPDHARLSISWVGLKPDEVLNPHQHPTASMIIVCEGEGEIMGDCNQSLKAGDIAAIPPHNKHGFIGRGKKGFWGLSIQFEGLGLYEDRKAPRVQFAAPNGQFVERRVADSQKDYELLLKDQHHYEKLYKRSSLLKLLKSSAIQDYQVQERLLEVLNYWGDWFQRILFTRAAQGHKSNFQDVAEDHLREEVGHNKNLLMARGNKPVQLWDPLLEGCAAWFYEQMACASYAERTVLVHFVLEGSGDIFHNEAAKIFTNNEHFKHHSAVEEDHFAMGCHLLKSVSPQTLKSLRRTLRQGWQMMTILCNRMAYIAKRGVS